MEHRLHLIALLGLALLYSGDVQGADDRAYKLSAGDALNINVYDEPDLSVQQRVDNNGFVSLPLVGKVHVEGLNLREAEHTIEQLYVSERYLANPDVTVMIREYAVRQASVLGEVEKPGQVTFLPESPRMEVVEAISRAGGFTGLARTKAVRITRTNENGEEESFIVDVNALVTGARTGNDSASNSFMILPGDVVFVPERIF